MTKIRLDTNIRDIEGQKRIVSFTTMAPSLEQVGVYLRTRLLKPTPKNLWQLINQLARNSLMTFFSLPLFPQKTKKKRFTINLSFNFSKNLLQRYYIFL